MASGFAQYTHWCKESAITIAGFEDTKQHDKPCPICSTKEKGLKNQKKNCCQYDTKIVKTGDNTFTSSKIPLELTLLFNKIIKMYNGFII